MEWLWAYGCDTQTNLTGYCETLEYTAQLLPESNAHSLSESPATETSYTFLLLSLSTIIPHWSVADLQSRNFGSAPPPPGYKFQFHAVFCGKIWGNCMLAPLPHPREVWRPHLRKILDPPLLTTGNFLHSTFNQSLLTTGNFPYIAFNQSLLMTGRFLYITSQKIALDWRLLIHSTTLTIY